MADKYINICRVRADDMICGHVNIPYGTEIEVDDKGFLTYIKNGEKKVLCRTTSERGYQWFAFNNDGRGRERKDIIKECIAIMTGMPDKDEKFAGFLTDATAMKYKKHPNDLSEWSWDREKVHTAPVSDLEHIRDMLKIMSSSPSPVAAYGNSPWAVDAAS